jgi:hypothetical protein
MPNWSIWWEWRSDAKCHIICCVNWRIYIDTMGKKIVLMNLNGNGKMDSILNVLVHWKCYFGLDFRSFQFGLFGSTQNLLNDFFWATYLVWTLIDFIVFTWACHHCGRILFKLGKAWYYLPPTFKKMACLSLIDPDPFDGHPLKVGMVSWVS